MRSRLRASSMGEGTGLPRSRLLAANVVDPDPAASMDLRGGRYRAADPARTRTHPSPTADPLSPGEAQTPNPQPRPNPSREARRSDLRLARYR